MSQTLHKHMIRIAGILLLLATAGCVTLLDESQKPHFVELAIEIEVPGAGEATKANVAPTEEEAAVHDVQVWAFSHHPATSTVGDSETTITQGSMTFSETATTGLYEITLLISDADVKNHPKLDFYVLVNGASLGVTIPDDVTRGQLKELKFGKTADQVDTFGPQALTSVVPATGLPFTCFYNNGGEGFDISFLLDKSLSKQEIAEKYIPTLHLSRAVSRLRFLFSRSSALTHVAVTNVTVQEFPTLTYVFPRETGSGIALPGATPTYENLTLAGTTEAPYLNTADIVASTNPLRFRRISTVVSKGQVKSPSQMDEAEYENFLLKELKDGNLTQRVFYLRETNQPLQGTITFSFAGTEGHTASFSMDATGNFPRNQTCTVYAYFVGEVMRFQVLDSEWTTAITPSHTFN